MINNNNLELSNIYIDKIADKIFEKLEYKSKLRAESRSKSKKIKPFKKGFLNDDSYKLLMDFILSKNTNIDYTPLNRARLFLGCFLLYSSGLRIQELRFFNFENYKKFIAGEVLDLNINTKTGYNQRKLCIIDFSKNYLKDNKHILDKNVCIVFNSKNNNILHKNNVPISRSHINKLFNGLLRDFSEKFPTFVDGQQAKYVTHTSFRYSYIHRLSEKGCDIDRISKIIGHRSIKTTSLYNIRKLQDSEIIEISKKI